MEDSSDFIRPPIKRAVKTMRQSEASECGLACLGMIANYWGHDFDLASLRSRFGASSRGMNLRQVMQTGDSLGLSPRPLKQPLEELDKLAKPAILHWALGHYVVLEKMKNGRALIHDPARGLKWHSHDSLDKNYTGIALELRPTPGFQPETDKRRLRVRDLWSKSTGMGQAFFQIFLLSLILQAYIIASPYLLRISVDKVVPSGNSSLLMGSVIGFGLLALFAGGAQILRSMTLLSAGSALSFGITANVARKLLRLPSVWFERRSIGDVLSRFQSVEPIQKLLVEKVPAALIDGILSVLTLAMIMYYSKILACISFVSFLVFSLFQYLTLNIERMAENDRIVASGKEQGVLIESLRGISTLRISGREVMRHAVWQNKLSEALGASYSHGRIKSVQEVGGNIINNIENVSFIGFGIFSVTSNELSLGLVFALLAYRLEFNQATRSLVSAARDAGMMKLHLERLSDIAMNQEDPGFEEKMAPREKFKGEIELRNVSYSYSPHDPKVLDNVSLKIKAGEHVAITGPSGGGKSTLVRLILGMADPDEGEILVDGENIKSYGRRSFRENIGVVLQEDHLFAGTIADNVCNFEEIDYDRMKLAMEKASVFEDIDKMPMKHLTMVGDMGSSLSGGQKQRILLARALYRNPRLIVMDEGTSALDANHEKIINQNISDMGITRIVIAHRKETIDSADRIIRLENGIISN
jgi:ATP-binding cassette subfamily B protein RaxB